LAKSLEQLGIFWLEEPFLPDALDAYARLADTVDIRVAAGEEDTTLWGFHVNAVLPDAWFQEYCVAETPLNTRLTRQTFPILQDGFVEVPSAPGLGVELDPEVLKRYSVGGRPLSVPA
jgi:L-alanine-DL-glutamate epimerase-like enolase superfamily enzyme